MSEKNVKLYFDDCLMTAYKHAWNLDISHSIHYGFYDKDNRTHDLAVQNYNKQLSLFGEIKPQSKVLDAGCGVGGSLIWLAKNLNCTGKGINIHIPSLKLARRYADSNKVIDKLEFIEASFLNIPFEDNTFDVVWAIESVCQSHDKEKFIKEAYRVLKPGGKILVADFFLKRKPKNKLENWHLNNWCYGWAMPYLALTSDFNDQLSVEGFKNIKIKNITKNILPSSNRMFYITVHSFLRTFISRLKHVEPHYLRANGKAAIHQRFIVGNLWEKNFFCAEK